MVEALDDWQQNRVKVGKIHYHTPPAKLGGDCHLNRIGVPVEGVAFVRGRQMGQGVCGLKGIGAHDCVAAGSPLFFKGGNPINSIIERQR